MKDKKFSNCLIDKKEIYVILCVDATLAKNKETSLSEFSSQLNEYQKLFDKEKTNILFEQDREDHVIDLIEKKKSLFMFFYNLSQTKLAKLRRYLKDVLAKN